MTPADQFKKELTELLKKWDAEISVEEVWVETPVGQRQQTHIYASGHAPITEVPDKVPDIQITQDLLDEWFHIDLGYCFNGDHKE